MSNFGKVLILSSILHVLFFLGSLFDVFKLSENDWYGLGILPVILQLWVWNGVRKIQTSESKRGITLSFAGLTTVLVTHAGNYLFTVLGNPDIASLFSLIYLLGLLMLGSGWFIASGAFRKSGIGWTRPLKLLGVILFLIPFALVIFGDTIAYVMGGIWGLSWLWIGISLLTENRTDNKAVQM